jgi:methanogenic corrinoid protein MtbC1
MNMSDVLQKLKQAVVEGDDDVATAAAQQALQEGAKALEIVSAAIVPGIQEAGRLWKDNKHFLPDVVMAAEAFGAAMAVVQPKLAGEGAVKAGKVLIGTVAGDMHTLGKDALDAVAEARALMGR